jgi:hypothetical protein
MPAVPLNAPTALFDHDTRLCQAEGRAHGSPQGPHTVYSRRSDRPGHALCRLTILEPLTEVLGLHA